MEATLKVIQDLVEDMSRAPSSPDPKSGSVLSEIRGKYAFVRTSVDEFLKRKHDDLELDF